MAVSGLFAICYGCFRFAVEFVRVPDAQLGYLAFGWLTMGQLLSLTMVLIGSRGYASRRAGLMHRRGFAALPGWDEEALDTLTAEGVQGIGRRLWRRGRVVVRV